MTDTARLFLALWPGSGVRDAVLGWRDAWAWTASTSLVEREHLHLTLHFLGDVPRHMLPALTLGLSVPFSRFDVSFGLADLWPGGVAVLQPDLVPGRLQQLHASLTIALQRLALPIDTRSFRPHITLASHTAGAVRQAYGPRILWRVCGYALIESQPEPRGTYRVLKRYRRGAECASYQ